MPHFTTIDIILVDSMENLRKLNVPNFLGPWKNLEGSTAPTEASVDRWSTWHALSRVSITGAFVMVADTRSFKIQTN